jgi:hypothetical protein
MDGGNQISDHAGTIREGILKKPYIVLCEKNRERKLAAATTANDQKALKF